jgi:hypothetical protein
MAYPNSSTEREAAGIDLRDNAIGILFLLLTVAVCLLRLFVPSNLMNLVMFYTEEGGPFYQKLHVGTYALVALTLVVLSTRRLTLSDKDAALLRSVLRYGAVLSTFVLYFAITSRLSAIGFIVETYLSAVLVTALLLALNEQSRRMVATTVLFVLVVSAVIGLGEVILGHRLLPFDKDILVQRATGLTDHPLSLGAQCVVAISFVPLVRWPLWIKIASILILLLGCVSANARSALAASCLEILLLILIMPWPNLKPGREWRAKAITLFATLLLGVLFMTALLSLGFLSRFDSVVDSSSLARVQIYEIFHYVSWKDILLGMDGAELARIVKEKVGLDYIESAPVFFIMLMGLPMAIAFTVIVIGFIQRLLRGAPLPAKIGATVFLIVDLTNNALATKTADMMLLAILVIGLRNSLGTAPASRNMQPASDVTHAYRSLPDVRRG